MRVECQVSTLENHQAFPLFHSAKGYILLQYDVQFLFFCMARFLP